ncbi:hypothetical protein Tco_1298835 [Tanacetum coccineum]
MEANCVNLELRYQNQALKFRQHGQILNETSNKAKIKMEKDVVETINIELKHSVAKLLAENKQLNKENEHLKQIYKDLYDSIKKTRVQTKDHNDSLIAHVNSKTIENADLKAQIQEKVFANVTLKNELRKLKGTSVDTKFAKPSILGKPVLQPLRNQLVVRQPTAFKEFVFAKPHHVIAPGSSRNSSKESYGSNDMAHKYYLEEAKKKTQDKNTNLKPREMPSTRTHHTPNACTPKLRINNQMSRNWPASKSSDVTFKVVQKAYHSRNPSSFSDSKHFVCSTCQKCVFNANHDARVTKFLKEILTGHRFSPNKSSAMYEKTSPRSCLRWKPTGRIFNTVGLRWVPTGNIFTSSTTKVDSEPPNGSNEDITNPYECEQTLNVSFRTRGKPSSLTPYVLPSKKDYDILFQPLFNEYFKPPSSVVSPRLPDAAPLPADTHLQQPQLLKMLHLLVLHQQLRKFKLQSFIKVLRNKFKEFKMHNLIVIPSSIILLQTRVLKNHRHRVSFHQICINSINSLIISQSGQRITHWTMSLAILLDLFRQEVNYKPMPYGATLMYRDI